MRTFTLTLAMAISVFAIAQTPIDLPINWEGTTTNYTVTDFGGNASMVVADPTDPTNTVLQSEKTVSAATWAGTTLSTTAGLATAIPFSAGNTTISVDVWSPDAGIQVRLKAEDATDPTKSVETFVTTTVANGWETLVFDFSMQAPGTAAIDFTYTYNMLSIFYNFDVDGATAGSKTYYCDNIVFGGAVANMVDVTFRVDLSTYTGSYTDVNLNGTFNNWCGGCAIMTSPNNDSIFELQLSLPENDTIEYKFTLDGWTVDEQFTAGTPCTKTTGAFTNRVFVPTSTVVLDPVCWESCDVCGTISTEDFFISELAVSPNPSTGIFILEGTVLSNEQVQIVVSDIQGKLLLQTTASQTLNERIDLSSFDNGLYILSISSSKGVMTKKLMISK